MVKEWKIYTKTGDKGETSLLGGKRVPKYHLRIEAYGTLDELNSFIGYLRDQLDDLRDREVLFDVQEKLFTAESILAADTTAEIAMSLPRIRESDIRLLEVEIDRIDQLLPELRSFILPGGHPLVSLCHICRTVCRRAERLSIRLAAEVTVDELVIQYLNRLSDYLFMLARKLTKDNGITDVVWKPER